MLEATRGHGKLECLLAVFVHREPGNPMPTPEAVTAMTDLLKYYDELIAEVTDGLSEGERVVVHPDDALEAGAPVELRQ